MRSLMTNGLRYKKWKEQDRKNRPAGRPLGLSAAPSRSELERVSSYRCFVRGQLKSVYFAGPRGRGR